MLRKVLLIGALLMHGHAYAHHHVSHIPKRYNLHMDNKTMSIYTKTLYMEARGGHIKAMDNVAHVILNRVTTNYPMFYKQTNIKKVTLAPYQFSAWNSSHLVKKIRHDSSWAEASIAAHKAYNEKLQGIDPTHGALFYMLRKVVHKQKWTRHMNHTLYDGFHVFFKPRNL